MGKQSNHKASRLTALALLSILYITLPSCKDYWNYDYISDRPRCLGVMQDGVLVKQTLNLGCEDEATMLTFTVKYQNMSWTLECSEDWISLSKTYGNPVSENEEFSTINVGVSENDSFEGRVATITLRADSERYPIVHYITVTQTGAPREFTANGVKFKMVYVAGGTFQMGATDEQVNSGLTIWDDEKPVHSVTLSSYYIGQTEVTQALWYAVMGAKPSSSYSWESTRGLGDNYPAYYISYTECEEFITKLNNLTGQTFRMPTEAEWEYAARGGNKSKGYIFSGSDNIGDVAWYYNNSSSTTHIVATKKANELGIYDMSGNVWEWCYDWYSSTYYSSSPQSNPTGPTSGSYRVHRGGSWSYDAANCRVANRNYYSPSNHYSILGLRLAL